MLKGKKKLTSKARSTPKIMAQFSSTMSQQQGGALILAHHHNLGATQFPKP